MKNVLPISIIIPAKNEEKNLEVLLESIKKQTHQPFEIILADANSTDDTVKIAKEYGVKVVDGGMPSLGRNNGFKASTQSIILFIDADICFLGNDDLFNIYSSFVKQNLDCATCHFTSIGKSTFEKRAMVKLINVAKDISASSPLKELKWDWGAMIIIKRDVFKSIGGFVEEFEYMEDTLMVQNLVRMGFRYKVLKESIGLRIKQRKDGDKLFFSNIRVFGALIFGLLSVSFARYILTQGLALTCNRISRDLYGALGEVIKYENPYKPRDREGGFPKSLSQFKRRFYETLPGLLLWFLLLSPFIFALMRWDQAFVVYIAFLVGYWSLRTVKFLVGIYIGLKRVKRDTQVDWVARIKEEGKGQEYDKLRFIYMCPVYAETLDVLEPSFEAWVNSDIGADKMDVVMAIEERKQDLQLSNFEILKEKYGKRLGSMTYFIHPFGIEGEVAGVKGANINWAARHFVKELEERGKDISNYLLISCDSDLRPHPKYLSAVAYKYLTVEDPKNRYYATALHTFNNNIWSVPSLIRAQSNMLTLVILQNWVVEKFKKIPFVRESIYVRDSFSSYIVNLETLKNFEFWDPEIANDDTAFYWNAMVRTKGTFKSEEVYVPTYNDAVENETYLKTHVSYYKQQHRWGWGVVNVPITLAAMFEDKNGFPLYRKLFLAKNIFQYQVWLLTIAFVLTFGLAIMGWLNPNYQYTVFSYNLPRILSYVFTIITLSNIPVIIFRRQVTPLPKKWPWWRHIIDLGETFLVTINMLTFGFLPYVQAQTEMMLGLAKFKRNFYVTDKVRMK